uniref:T6SS Phospholipase effector Tle1-like catalytic domain-containing protein n=1 Tax=Schizophyllum commune (strain H4-8 / FGSC 9210) TaxID=578458 RepID=D8QL12_SCHCM
MAQPTGRTGSPEFETYKEQIASPTRNLEETIPPNNRHRAIVLCFDGTGDQFDEDNSNIVSFLSLLKKDDPSKQLVYYQSGIGTYNIPQIAKPMMAKFKRLLDSMVAVHLNAHVMGGYEYIMNHYHVGDKIYIFGFSRGAYIARALAGMLHKIGLLPRGNQQQVAFAYKMYTREDDLGWKQSNAFKKAFCIDVNIELLGVWDTVGSVGLFPRRLPFTTSNSHVRYFRHALALDERRVRFQPNFWIRSHPAQHALGVQPGEMPRSRPEPKSTKTKLSLREKERTYDAEAGLSAAAQHTDVLEVWFAGCHCDVGGGSVRNDERHSLARIPLRWMIRQCFLLETDILFHRELLPKVGLDPETLWPVVRPKDEVKVKPMETSSSSSSAASTKDEARFLGEEEEDRRDALSPVYDQLSLKPHWWFLEVIPAKVRYKLADNATWLQKLFFRWHLGQGRVIPKRQKKHGIHIHKTVRTRMEAEELKYKPRAKVFDDVEPIWVE